MRTSTLLLIWLKTFLYSLTLSALMLSAGAKYNYEHTYDIHTTVELDIKIACVAALYLNLLLLIMSMLSMFITLPRYYQQPFTRALLYFGGIILTVFAILMIMQTPIRIEAGLLVCAVYFVVSLFFYRRLPKSADKSI